MSYIPLKYLIYIIISFLLLSGAYLAIIHILFEKKRQVRNACPEVWSHRGMNNAGLEENSIEAFEYACNKGLKGIEIDVYWDEHSEKLLVTHDQPKQNTNYKSLDLYLSRFKDSTSYWIDLKNLTCKNQAAIEKAFTSLLSTQGQKTDIYIESQNGWALRKFDNPRIKTIFWAQYNRSGLIRFAKLIYLKSIIVASNFDGISCSYKLYDKDFMDNFEGFSVFLFHLNNKQVQEMVTKKSAVHVLLADDDYLSTVK